METRQTTLFYRPESEALRFLPEGPYRCADDLISWVAIQLGPESTEGSLNLLDLNRGHNRSFALDGRPGFAFPTNAEGCFVVGLERRVILFDTRDGSSQLVIDGVDADVEGTIINDGITHDGHLIFGCKDLTFTEKKAGLYLVRRGERKLIQLANDQICSNGKAIASHANGTETLYDICSPTRKVLAWDLDCNEGRISNPRVAVDLTSEPAVPDGMLLTPDGQSLIVAMFHPGDAVHGEARQYDIATGDLQVTWICENSPRVTCPQLIERDGKVLLLLTTADEGMPPDLRAKATHAGCMFVGETDFTTLNHAPRHES